jgi:hypothetical protein
VTVLKYFVQLLAAAALIGVGYYAYAIWKWATQEREDRDE